MTIPFHSSSRTSKVCLGRGVALCAFYFMLSWLGLTWAAPATGHRPTNSCEGHDLYRVIGEIQHHYQITKSFRADFLERIVPQSGQPRTRRGKIYFQKPGRMRWDFASPDIQTVVSDGATLYSYQPDLNQVVEVPISRAFSSSAATAFLLGVGRLEQDFKPAWPASQPTNGSVAVTLKPKLGQGLDQTIGLEVDPQTCAIKAVRIEDQIGNVTHLEFLNSQTNVDLDPSMFHFKAPAGADVVEAP
jgi:outer membrane lipoprotein carrier protein